MAYITYISLKPLNLRRDFQDFQEPSLLLLEHFLPDFNHNRPSWLYLLEHNFTNHLLAKQVLPKSHIPNLNTRWNVENLFHCLYCYFKIYCYKRKHESLQQQLPPLLALFFNFFIFLDLDIALDSRVHKNGLNFTLRVSRRSDTWICRWREFPSFLCVSPGLNSFSSCASLTGGLLMEICSSASDIWSVILLRSRLFTLLTALAPLSGHAFDIGRERMISAIHTSLG